MVTRKDVKAIVAPTTESAEESTKTKREAPSPFDPEALRLTEKDRAELGITVNLVELACRKPKKQEWVRANPELAMDTVLLKLEDSDEFYIVSGEMRLHSDLFEVVQKFRIQLTVNRAGSWFFWPARIPEDDGGAAGASWHRSALECQRRAEGEWVRMVADRGAGAYVIHTAAVELPEPKWPSNDMKSLLELSFKARLIDNPDHQVLKMLRGEV